MTLTATTIPGLKPFSSRTVRYRLCEQNIRPRHPVIRPVLLQRHRQCRLQWCRQYLRFRRVDWNNVLFSDESLFHLDSSDDRACVYRCIGECYVNPCIVQRQNFGGGSVMVWGGISFCSRTKLVVVHGNLMGVHYRDEFIQPHVLPYVQGKGCCMTFQYDNARPNVASVGNNILAQQNVNVFPWPAVSPDLSPIEHVWDEMERRLHRQQNQPLTLDQLALVNIWNCIPQVFFTNLVTSMHHCCQACLNANGGHTHY